MEVYLGRKIQSLLRLIFIKLTRVSILSDPLKSETEITGPIVAKLFLSSSTEDCDIFITLQAFSETGKEVYFQGTVDPRTPLAQGWLRASIEN